MVFWAWGNFCVIWFWGYLCNLLFSFLFRIVLCDEAQILLRFIEGWLVINIFWVEMNFWYMIYFLWLSSFLSYFVYLFVLINNFFLRNEFVFFWVHYSLLFWSLLLDGRVIWFHMYTLITTDIQHNEIRFHLQSRITRFNLSIKLQNESI